MPMILRCTQSRLLGAGQPRRASRAEATRLTVIGVSVKVSTWPSPWRAVGLFVGAAVHRRRIGLVQATRPENRQLHHLASTNGGVRNQAFRAEPPQPCG